MTWKEKLKLWLLKNNIVENNEHQIKRVFKGVPGNETPDERRKRKHIQLQELKERLKLKDSAITTDNEEQHLKNRTDRSIKG